MKVKSLIKVAQNDKVKFTNDYNKGDNILIDGCFVPYYKAVEDKRKVDTFYIDKVNDSTILSINTVYIKENVPSSSEISKKKKEKKNKNKKKGKKVI